MSTVAEADVDQTPEPEEEQAKIQTGGLSVTGEPSTEPEKAEKQPDPVEVLVPRVDPRTWKITERDPDVLVGDQPQVVAEREYVQKSLSFFQKIELFALLSETIDQAMAGDDGVSLGTLLEGPRVRGNQIGLQDVIDADEFVKGVTRLVRYSPTLLEDLYAILLGVPQTERVWFKNTIRSPEDRGGLSDEEGFEILETFVDQNWEAIADFFGDRIGKLVRRGRARAGGGEESQSPKPSSTTPAPTPSQ